MSQSNFVLQLEEIFEKSLETHHERSAPAKVLLNYKSRSKWPEEFFDLK